MHFYSVLYSMELRDCLSLSSKTQRQENSYKKRKQASFAPKHLPFPSAYSVPEPIPFLVSATYFSASKDVPLLLPLRDSACRSRQLSPLVRICLNCETRGSNDQGISEALRVCFAFPACSPSGYFVSAETTSTTDEGFSSRLAMWSKCWANTLFYATFLFENDSIEYNA